MEEFVKKFIFLIIFSIALINLNGLEKISLVEKESEIINKLLNDFHLAASKANESEYMGYLSEDSIFMGTASEEIWTKEQFRKYTHPYFSKGRGWTYIPKDRHLKFSENKRIAWFYEKLLNERYGTLRGSGVLRKEGNGEWKIVQYNMVFTIPNDVAKKVVEIIQKTTNKTSGI